MNKIYEKYWSDDDLRLKRIKLINRVGGLFGVFFFVWTVCLAFFSKGLHMGSTHDLIAYVSFGLVFVFLAIQLEVLRVIDLVKRKIQENHTSNVN